MANRSFKDMCDDLINGIIGATEEMNKKGLVNEKTTFEDVANYAGQHVVINELSEEPSVCKESRVSRNIREAKERRARGENLWNFKTNTAANQASSHTQDIPSDPAPISVVDSLESPLSDL